MSAHTPVPDSSPQPHNPAECKALSERLGGLAQKRAATGHPEQAGHACDICSAPHERGMCREVYTFQMCWRVDYNPPAQIHPMQLCRNKNKPAAASHDTHTVLAPGQSRVLSSTCKLWLADLLTLAQRLRFSMQLVRIHCPQDSCKSAPCSCFSAA